MKYFIPTWSMRNTAAFVVAFLLLAGVGACKKDSESGFGDGETVVRVQMVGTESDEGNNPLSNSKQSTKNTGKTTRGPQVFTIPFGDDMMITATLEEVSRAGNPIGNEAVVKRASANGSGNRAANQKTPLGSGVRYGILVYDEDGDLFADKEYTHGSGYSSDQDTIGGLTAGKTYTFVGYSINSTSDLPTINNKETLTGVETALTDQDLMIFRDDMEIAAGSNTLQVVLKHKFIEILPTISIAESSSTTAVWGGVIEAIGGMSFNGTHEHGAVRINDNTYSFSTNTVDKAVTFPAIPTGGTTSLTATAPLLLISPATASGNFTIDGLVINDISHPVDVSELNLEPGKKYNLKLTFNTPCIANVGTDSFWIPDHSTPQWSVWENLPDADFGFMFDVHTLDNSFDMEVNGESIVETRRVYQYRTRTSFLGQLSAWSAWTDVTSTVQTRSTSRTVSSNVSFPLFWDWTPNDLDFQQSAKANEDFAINNVAFADGDIYGGAIYNEGGTGDIRPLWDDTYWNGAPHIAHLRNPNGPIIKVQITPTGEVHVFGKRTVDGEHELMQILPEQTSRTKYYATNTVGAAETDNPGSHLREERAILETRLNPNVQWNSSGTNTVRVRQRIVNRTWMWVEGYGLNRIVCP